MEAPYQLDGKALSKMSDKKNKSDKPRRDDDGGLLTATRPKAEEKTKKPRMYKVILHNDDYTTMEFVIQVLVQFFHKNHAEATHLMLYVHHKGKAVVGLYSYDVAHSKAQQVIAFARESGHPLMCTTEPE
jgi:ATP-dependent Clp protease adaptor protein ClpS